MKMNLNAKAQDEALNRIKASYDNSIAELQKLQEQLSKSKEECIKRDGSFLEAQLDFEKKMAENERFIGEKKDLERAVEQGNSDKALLMVELEELKAICAEQKKSVFEGVQAMLNELSEMSSQEEKLIFEIDVEADIAEIMAKSKAFVSNICDEIKSNHQSSKRHKLQLGASDRSQKRRQKKRKFTGRHKYTTPRTCPICRDYSSSYADNLRSHFFRVHGGLRLSQVFHNDGTIHMTQAEMRNIVNKKKRTQELKQEIQESPAPSTASFHPAAASTNGGGEISRNSAPQFCPSCRIPFRPTSSTIRFCSFDVGGHTEQTLHGLQSSKKRRKTDDDGNNSAKKQKVREAGQQEKQH